jgi:hypothetical protein
MPKRTGKKPGRQDVNQLARRVMERIEELTEVAQAHPGKDPLAVAMGRRGGLKGGRARMDSMTPEERRKLAVKAAAARWKRPATKR